MTPINPTCTRGGLLRVAIVAALLAVGGGFAASPALAQGTPAKANVTQTYQSKNFILHTDISPDDAKTLLTELETMLSLISKYWGRPNRQVIEMFVAEGSVQGWPRAYLEKMDPSGIASIVNRAGVTIGITRSLGNQRATKSTVYCIAKGGVPKHEAVHAYCQQTFGTSGPLWYSEGMAEMGQYWQVNSSNVKVDDYVIKYLRQTQPKSLNDIINPTTETTGDSWQNYAWRWALCHLLAYNPNYQARFLPLGRGLLEKQEITFEQVYGPMANEIIFEYLFFLNHMEQGYRMDLCAWDWSAKFSKVVSPKTQTARVKAAAGWQPSRMLVEGGQKYDFSATGKWTLASDQSNILADGNSSGAGRLMGVVFRGDYTLTEPFELGSYGTFTAPADGQLWLRCRDDWGKLDDNEGALDVVLKANTPGSELPKPAAVAYESPAPGASTNTATLPASRAASEAKANSKLRLAKLLLTRDAAKAREYLQEAIELAPGTPIAQEAQALLGRL